MKNIVYPSTNLPDFFAANPVEPFLLTNTTGKQFLVLPANTMRWQELFYHLYSLPDTFFINTALLDQKRSNVTRICGSMKGMLSSADDFSREKKAEKEREENKFKRL
ncbi:MAG TPA: hypothetical protein DCQ31_07210 [Bacteroidales bacterium]|nr:hypothetical protein [Bacteroidales bacterium]